ncbi:MAG: YggS family pyridoxal phosphate-dependent enzyme [Aggregatilineales bacterium]
MTSMSTIADNVARVRDEIVNACARVNRDPEGVTLIAVSKTKPAEDILHAIEAGLQHFGENRVQESQEKIPLVESQTDKPLVWHMIGHVQSRKAKEVVPLFEVVHSIDSIKLADKLAKSVSESARSINALIEINVSGEISKEGLNAYGWQSNQKIKEDISDQIRHISQLAGLNVIGLMTMAPFVDNMAGTRPVFADLAALREMLSNTLNISLPELSMGMTNDYPIAIEEGATMVRVGRAIFGERS